MVDPDMSAREKITEIERFFRTGKRLISNRILSCTFLSDYDGHKKDALIMPRSQSVRSKINQDAC